MSRKLMFALCACFLILSVYFSGYFALSHCQDFPALGRRQRQFPTKTIAKAYGPAIRLESLVTGRQMGVGWFKSFRQWWRRMDEP